MARALAELDPRPENDFALEFEEPAFLTLGICYERNGRFSGGAYQPVVRRVEEFLRSRLPNALETRGQRGGPASSSWTRRSWRRSRRCRARGFESPYLKAFVVARINPLRFKRGAKAEFDETIAKMLAAATRFDAGKVKPDQLARQRRSAGRVAPSRGDDQNLLRSLETRSGSPHRERATHRRSPWAGGFSAGGGR